MNETMIKPSDTIIAYFADTVIRHKATSGGVGSCIIKELFNRKRINSSISFKFDKENLKYSPELIQSYDDYAVSGSIYHEINLINFIKENIGNIKSPFACFALPCQVTPIKSILDKNNIESYIIELTCSSQQRYEATEFLIKKSNINKKDISMIRYRGNGWPGGTHITLHNGESIFFDNTNSIWTKIFHSHLFIVQRCFLCSPTKETASDIILADPWNIDHPKDEKEGRSLCFIKTLKMASLLNELADESAIIYEKRDRTDFLRSQLGVIIRKNFNLKHKGLTKLNKKILNSELYRNIVLKSDFTFKLHCFIYKYTFRILHKIEKTLNKNIQTFK